MKKAMLALLLALGAAGAWGAEGSGVRFGAGANYWVALDDIDVKDVDDSGFSYLLSLQYRGEWAGIGLDAEMLPDRFGEDSYAGQAYLLLGKTLYAGAGVGLNYTDGKFADDPFFSLRAGLDLELLPRLHLDIYANYRFNDKAQFEDSETDIDTDTVFLGAALRLGF